MNKFQNLKARQENIVTQELKGELLIYDLAKHKAFCLNETSAMVYQLCDGKHGVSQIRASISKKFKRPVTEDLVWLALDQLKQDNLLEESSEVEIKFEGLSRREAIRRVGLVSMIALPVISSLVAPTAAMAQSKLICTGMNSAGFEVICTADPSSCGVNALAEVFCKSCTTEYVAGGACPAVVPGSTGVCQCT